MGLWKDLLFLGGHVATPAGLEALGATGTDGPAAADAATAEAKPAPQTPQPAL